MEPARTIIAMLGGDTAVSRLLGIHRTKVAVWKSRKRGTGTIPLKHIPTLLAVARERGLRLTAEDFLPRKDAA